MNKDHNYIQLSDDVEIKYVVLYKKDNNLDELDNLNELPEQAAVYAICGRVNGQPVNPRFVGVTSNLKESIMKHFDSSESHDCLRQFMQSIKIKSLIYKVLEDSGEEQREKAKLHWQDKYKPECNEMLNEIH
ncbi:MAG: hypothetical protein MI921_02895 [Cytophagales bacterium]|nr:hypothetical protein [Cytophagales bacterium]